MGRHPTRKQTPIQHSLNDPRDEGGAVELRHLLGDGDVRGHHGVVVDQHVLVLVVARLLEAVGGLVEDGAVERCRDELEDAEDAGFALGGAAVAPEEELEEALADCVAVEVESVECVLE